MAWGSYTWRWICTSRVHFCGLCRIFKIKNLMYELALMFFFSLRCGNINWAKRTKCNICNTNKPGHNEGGVRYWIEFFYIPSWWLSICMLGSVWVCFWSFSWSLFVKCIPLCFMENTMKYFILGDWEISTYEVLSKSNKLPFI